MWWLGREGLVDQMLIVAVLVCLLAVSVVLLLADSIPHRRPLFHEAGRPCGAGKGVGGGVRASGRFGADAPRDACTF